MAVEVGFELALDVDVAFAVVAFWMMNGEMATMWLFKGLYPWFGSVARSGSRSGLRLRGRRC